MLSCGILIRTELLTITSHSSRTNNSWLFAPSSPILANHYLPLNGALVLQGEGNEFEEIWNNWGFGFIA
jgi:hypothetical protein